MSDSTVTPPTARREAAVPDVRRPAEGIPGARRTILAAGLGLGVAGDLLLNSSDGPGLNLFLLLIGLALAVGVVARRARLGLSGEALAWMASGVLLASGFVLRASPALHLLAFLGAAAAFAFPALRAGAAWIRGSGVSDQMEAIGGALAHVALGALRFLGEGMWSEGADRTHTPPTEGAHEQNAPTTPNALPANRGRARRSPVWAVLRGILLAVPLLFVFGALLVSADAVFSQIVTDAIGVVDAGKVASHLFVAGLLTWLTFGYLSGFLSGTRVRGWIPPATPRPTLGTLEAGTVLALVDLLFAAFVIVQLRYLFGGSTLVEVTPGLTYAEYAREGFVQLVVATALVLLGLLAFDWLLRRDTPWAARAFRVLAGVQLLLLGVVIASAVQRLRVYQDAYGLTESRFYGGVFLGWLTFVAVWFAVTVLRGRRDRFARVSLISGYIVVAGLLLANPDARIAKANLARDGSFDAAYLGSLSADALPTLIGALPSLPPEERCALAGELRDHWGPQPSSDWRSWNLSEARARRLVRSEGAAWLGSC